MRNIWLLATKEYKQLFISPTGYAVAFAVFLLLGILFYASIVFVVNQQTAPTIQIIFGPLVTILIFPAPAFTLRSIADEQRSRTLGEAALALHPQWSIPASLKHAGEIHGFSTQLCEKSNEFDTEVYKVLILTLKKCILEGRVSASHYRCA